MDRECFFLFFLLLPTFVLFIFATLQLLETGYSPFSLVRYAKATVVDLKELGFSAKEIRFLDFSLDQLMREGEFSLVELFEAGYHVSDFKKRRGWAPDYYVLSKLRDAGYTAVELKDNGFTIHDLVRKGGFTIKHLKNIKPKAFEFEELCQAEPTATEWRDAGYTAQRLKGELGFDPLTLARGGFKIPELVHAGFTAEQMRLGGKGFSALSLVEADAFTPKELTDGGYSIAEVKKACETNSKTSGTTGAQKMAEDGFSAEELKAAGASCQDIYDTGVMPRVLKDLGFSMKEITDATGKDSATFLYNEVGYNSKELWAANYTATDLRKNLNITTKELYECGYTCMECTVAGATLVELRDWYTTKDLKSSGWTHLELKAIGFNFLELRRGGWTNHELLREAGFTMRVSARNIMSIGGVEVAPLNAPSHTVLIITVHRMHAWLWLCVCVCVCVLIVFF